MKVGGGMVLGDGLTAPGVIDMRGAEIADNLRFIGSMGSMEPTLKVIPSRPIR